jgi:hypothetical protein
MIKKEQVMSNELFKALNRDQRRKAKAEYSLKIKPNELETLIS